MIQVLREIFCIVEKGWESGAWEHPLRGVYCMAVRNNDYKKLLCGKMLMI